MYQRFYGLARKPFSITPQSEFLYPSRQHRAAIELLQYGIDNRAPFVVITGEVGVGKTMLLQHLLDRRRGDTSIASVTHAHGDYPRLLRWISDAFGVYDRDALDDFEIEKAVIEHVEQQHRRGRSVVVMIDEAQGLTLAALEQLRLLSNVNRGGEDLFQVVLAGQSGLRASLLDPALHQLAQRVLVDYHLKPLAASETHEYVRHRLQVAGAADGGPFDAEALDLVHEATRGTPRLINIMCDFSLLYGCSLGARRISRAVVEQVVADRAEAIAMPEARLAEPAAGDAAAR